MIRQKVADSAQLPQALRKDEQLYFMHIPKTAGTSLIAVLDQHFTNDEICPLDRGTRKTYQSLPEEDRSRFKFIRGHFPYSLINDLDHPRTITFLRDPVKRTLSAIKHHYRLEEQGEPSFKDIILKDMPMEDFVAHPVLGNFVVNKANKYLNDMLVRRPLDAPPPDLGLAKKRLETFEFIGITERFEESLQLLSYTFGFPPIKEFPVLQANPEGEKQRKASKEMLDQLTEMNHDEIELYEYGMQLFEERLAAMRANPAQGVMAQPESPPAGSIFFDFRRVDPGRGWHVGEAHPLYGVLRWSGPGTESQLKFRLQTERAYKIRFRVIRAIAPQVLESLAFEVNGKRVPLSMHPEEKQGSVIFEGELPASALKQSPEATIFTFKVAQTHYPKEFNPKNKDVRQLGLCYNWLHVYPA